MAYASYLKLNTFGDMLKWLRRRASLTQTQLGDQIGYSHTLIARFESNSRRPNLELVTPKLIVALGIADEPEIKQRFIELACQNKYRTHGNLKHGRYQLSSATTSMSIG